jgi:hypothetical protein
MTRKAVLCGVNQYEYAPLMGCINDVNNLQRLLVETFNFPAHEIHTLIDEQVTKSNIYQEWQWLTGNAQANDTLVFHFSGHGSHVPDRSGDEQDLRDEISCLCNMDFNNPDTYLSDDEWFEMAQQVPPAVRLIILKDTCHSGGSSRFLSVRTAAGTDRVILADVKDMRGHTLDEVIPEKRVTNARFLVPPDVPAEIWQTSEASRSLAAPVRSTRLAQTPQTSLMACMETQTAADAYIAGDFHGAFTYHLCETLRQDPQLNSQELIDALVETLRGRYSQVPQHEGKVLPAPLFGKVVIAVSPPPTPAKQPSPPTPAVSLPSAMPPLADGQTTQQMLIQVHMTLIQAHMKLLDTLATMPMQSPLPAAQGRHTGQRALVAVHGISYHEAGYSDRWWQALAPYVGDIYDPSELGEGRREVLWSDLVNQSRALARSVDTAEMADLRQSILDVIEDRRDHSVAHPESLDQMPTTRGGGIAIDDFLIYMLNNVVRNEIIQRFTTVVEPLLAADNTIDIISHSWGTVVAYEGLRELEQRGGLRGRVANWFTVGSALSIAPVQGRLRPENRPQGGNLAPYPVLVDTWVNLDAQGDLVGGRLSRKFPVHQEYLNLQPIPCEPGFWGYNLACAHGSYFTPENQPVQSTFASYILAVGLT